MLKSNQQNRDLHTSVTGDYVVDWHLPTMDIQINPTKFLIDIHLPIVKIFV